MKLHKSNDGGVVIVWQDENGNEKRLRLDVDENGNVIEKGIGPSGSKQGERDPSGGGSNSLGV